MEIERLSQVGAFTWMWVVDLGSKQRRKISTNDRLEGKRLFELLTGIAAIGGRHDATKFGSIGEVRVRRRDLVY
jgi:hypothetical protein